MAKYLTYCSALLLVAIAVSAFALADGTKAKPDAPSYTADGRLILPSGYYQWAFLTSDLGMSYNEDGSKSDNPPFSNVFVNPAAYQAFLKTGTWPDKTQIVKEFRPSSTKGSINQHGYFQSGKATAVLVHVKDKSRFKGGWAFFIFSGDDSATPAEKIPTSAGCYSCHSAHGAVDTTFVQFYPTLLPSAKKHGTLSTNYLKDEAAQSKASNK
ncbi:MAG: cytochrome P460 family protein [Terriglobia bacterium]